VLVEDLPTSSTDVGPIAPSTEPKARSHRLQVTLAQSQPYGRSHEYTEASPAHVQRLQAPPSPHSAFDLQIVIAPSSSHPPGRRHETSRYLQHVDVPLQSAFSSHFARTPPRQSLSLPPSFSAMQPASPFARRQQISCGSVHSVAPHETLPGFDDGPPEELPPEEEPPLEELPLEELPVPLEEEPPLEEPPPSGVGVAPGASSLPQPARTVERAHARAGRPPSSRRTRVRSFDCIVAGRR
jgi:hypothetical protein